MLNGVVTAALLSPLLFAAPLSSPTYPNVLTHALVSISQMASPPTINLFTTVEPGPEYLVELALNARNGASMSELEGEMLDLINDERVSRGLEPLTGDGQLARLARRHSADMFARGYFSHNTPDGKSPFDRMREANVRFSAAGENLALAATVRIAHNSLMRSAGHRANILSRRFGRVGIGIVRGRRGLMISQEFRD